ncbi:sn-glycerol-3-phosphate ABC transporter ATP-binding protein UgpC [Sulfitobacter sp. LCG007]
MAEITLENVSKSFGAVKVIDDVSLTVQSGELVVFLGPSGSGKSTLLRMIAGLESIDEGRLTIGGKECQNVAPGQRDVAMVFQNYALYPHMTVRENMAFGLRNIRMAASEIERRVGDAARILEMEALLDRRPAQLSGGQRQRVAIGRAIVKEPAAFLFDEPLSNLDAALRARTRVELAELHQRMKSTMIYVTHDQTEAMTLASRIVILNNCRIEQIGTPLEVYANPASRFVAGFVGSPPMNILNAEVTGQPDAPVAVLSNGARVPLRMSVPAPGKYDLGVRPDALRVVDDGGDVTGRASVVEHLGDRTLIYVQLANGVQLTAQVSGRSRLRPGDQLGLSFDPGQLHLFDEAGKAHHSEAV